MSTRQYRQLLVIQELYCQQKIMHKTKTHRINNRIVSICHPHIRPIVRGKTGANGEFGAKPLLVWWMDFPFWINGTGMPTMKAIISVTPLKLITIDRLSTRKPYSRTKSTGHGRTGLNANIWGFE